MARVVAAISVLKPSIGVSYNTPIADVSYNMPIADVDYILIHAVALLDTTGLYRYTVDSVVSSDGVRFSLGKVVGDSAAATDQLKNKQVAKSVRDVVAFSDVLFRTMAFARISHDFQALSDAKKIQITKVFADFFGFTDKLKRTFGKVRSDNFGLTDTQVRSILKRLNDTAIAIDAKTYVLSKLHTDLISGVDVSSRSLTKAQTDNFGLTDTQVRLMLKKLTDSAIATDAKAYALSKNTTDLIAFTDARVYDISKTSTDTVIGSDTLLRATSKKTTDSFSTSDVLTMTRFISRYLTDAFALNDGADIGDGITYQSIKTVINLATVSDIKAYAISKRLVDASLVSDAGLLVSQGYCDLTYFSADYVGSARQF
jgi:hypothetical protein